MTKPQDFSGETGYASGPSSSSEEMKSSMGGSNVYFWTKQAWHLDINFAL